MGYVDFSYGLLTHCHVITHVTWHVSKTALSGYLNDF
jgi:hypothetical protein